MKPADPKPRYDLAVDYLHQAEMMVSRTTSLIRHNTDPISVMNAPLVATLAVLLALSQAEIERRAKAQPREAWCYYERTLGYDRCCDHKPTSCRDPRLD